MACSTQGLQNSAQKIFTLKVATAVFAGTLVNTQHVYELPESLSAYPRWHEDNAHFKFLALRQRIDIGDERLRSSGMFRSVVWFKFTDDTQAPSAFTNSAISRLEPLIRR